MKLVYKRSNTATALAEPEDTLVSETAAAEPAPAPAGALHRVYPEGGGGRHSAAEDASAEAYIPQRGSYGMRLHGGMPRSVAGRVLLGGGVFAVLAAAALTVAGVHSFLLHDSRFLIGSSSAISIEGNSHIPRAEILGVFGADLERNIFKVPLAERQQDLQRLPWVQHATVMRLLPSHIRVDIQERTPVAFTRMGTQIGLVDGDGVLLDMPPEIAGDPRYSFPVLTGLDPKSSPEARAARMEVYRRFMAEMSAAGPKVTQSLSEVDVTNPENVKALIATGSSDILVQFGDQGFLKRYQVFEQHLPEWRNQYPKLASVDMRYERQVVLEMAPEGGAAASAGTPALAAAAPVASSVPKPVTARVAPAGLPAGHRAELAHAAAEHAANQRMYARLAALHRAQQNRARNAAR